ncbi:AAA family ATPase [Natrarchaeobius oligotrophus]|uniref:Endonuclease GajA/Old nuclease/RecF-like AAA domain-containing protein n=1 Tax=Natrarchaeobius chitinivorans TaxID=1679083 RepID=A0A3N6N2M7_NATCH|nr:AAA family ATPase [Natrarchaeobius chitinivorans]RQH01907.1 hypothetical protein EA472_06265 [Natrarchaeobius chitinivorans]
MTEITNLHIRNFKGVSELDYSPKRLNLITGRNNTGKTSLLESINIIFNPKYIDNFSKNLDKVVHTNGKSATISAEYTRQQQTLDSNFTSQSPEVQHREIGFREPREQESVDIFINTLQDILETNEDYPIRIRHNESFEEEGFKEDMKDALTETITEMPEDISISGTRSNSIVLEIDGELYSYIHLGEYYEEIREHIISESKEKLQEKNSKESFDFEDPRERERLQHAIMRGLHNQLVPRFGSDRFVGNRPDPVEGVRLVKSPLLKAEDVDMSQENAAVKASDIEDYLIENNILENLEDFSFEKLVFRDDSEKYEIPYSFMGDGFRTIVGILWEVLSAEREGNVLLLEEPDVHMHPGYIESLLTQLVKVVREKNLQLFITTHNIDMIEGFFSDNLKSKEEVFLSDHFQLLQLTDPIPRTLDYRSAEEEIEDLNVDLRGI